MNYGKAAKAATLRHKAALCRQAASHKTNGGHLEDRLLIEIAEHLERQAAALEGVSQREH
jgi:hypothetical protein